MFTCVLAAACDEKLSEFTGPTPMLSPTFSSINQNIFQATGSSGCVACHNGRVEVIPVNLATSDPYSALVGRVSREKPGLKEIEPGDPQRSYLYLKLVGGAGISGKRMPFNGPFLTDGQLQVIARWIQQGAQNN